MSECPGCKDIPWPSSIQDIGLVCHLQKSPKLPVSTLREAPSSDCVTFPPISPSSQCHLPPITLWDSLASVSSEPFVSHQCWDTVVVLW